MIDTNTRLCCAGDSFLSSLIKYFQTAALVPKLWVLQQCAISQSASLSGCMKLQLTSAKVINSLADSDCKYYYLEDSLLCRCALNGPIKEVLLGVYTYSTSSPTLNGVSLLGGTLTYCPSWEEINCTPQPYPPPPPKHSSPSIPPNKKIYQFNNHTFYKNEIMGEGLRLISLNSCFTDLSLLWFPLLVCSCEERK